MKKRFSFYAISWTILLALFNVIAFVSPGWIGVEKYDAAFWIGYSFITVTFLGQLACAWFALKEESASKLFYKVSLITTSYTGLVITFVVGGLCMLISPLPYWVGIIACSIVLAANILAVMKAATAIDEVQKIDEKIKVQTAFIKMLTVDAERLISRAKSETIKAECQKVYEAIRFSDPMSNESLASIENEIASAFQNFADAVSKNDLDLATTVASELIDLIGNRNKKCKLMK